MAVKEHTIGEVRYFTYYIILPGEKDWSRRQVPFVGNLRDVLPTTTFGRSPKLARELLNKGEARWKDQNGVTHRIVIDTEALPERMFNPRKAAQLLMR